MDVSAWFFESIESIVKTVVVGLAAYATLIFMLRVSGKRTLSKMNMFDWVVTVAMGSIMASVLVSDGVSYLQGITAFATLIAAQFVVTSLSVRSETFASWVKASPTILYYRGEYLHEAMRKQRVPMSEVLSAIRQSGQGAPREIAAVVLEASGELIVMNEVNADQSVTLQQADNWQGVSPMES